MATLKAHISGSVQYFFRMYGNTWYTRFAEANPINRRSPQWLNQQASYVGTLVVIKGLRLSTECKMPIVIKVIQIVIKIMMLFDLV